MKKQWMAGMIVAVCLWQCGASHAARPLPSFGVVYNDDADLAYVVPDRARSDALLRANIAALADTPVKTLVYCIGMGGDLVLYPTQVASEVGWRKSADEKPGSLMEMRMENARVNISQGGDAVRTAGEMAKKLRLFFIPSLRLNDAHFMMNPDEHAMTSEFWLKNRDRFTIKDSPLDFQKAYGQLLDFSHAEVRAHRLATAFEAIERNQDLIDGFELDFNRFQVFFPKGKAEAGAPLITDMVRQVRARLDALAKVQKRPMYLFVRIPPSLADARFAGLEVEKWMEEGLVDLVSPAQIMTLAGDMPIRDLLELGRRHGVRIYPSLYPRTSFRLPFPSRMSPDRYAGAKVTRDATLAEIRAAAANYIADGADGFYLFNFYNAYGSLRPHEESLYRVFRDLARPDNLRGQAKVYFVTKSYYNDGPGSYAYGKQLPAALTANVPRVLTLPVGENLSAEVFPLKRCEFRLGFRGLPAGASLTVAVNGQVIHRGPAAKQNSWRTQDVTGQAPRQRDAAELYLHVPLMQPELIRVGDNEVTVTVSANGKATILTDCELLYEYHNDLDRLWRRQTTPLNEPELAASNE